MKRRDLLRGGSLVLCLGATDLAFGASIVAVRIWPAADYTRLTIESDQPLRAQNFVAENPYRLVIDIDNLELSPALRDLFGAAGLKLVEWAEKAEPLLPVPDLRVTITPHDGTIRGVRFDAMTPIGLQLLDNLRS